MTCDQMAKDWQSEAPSPEVLNRAFSEPFGSICCQNACTLSVQRKWALPESYLPLTGLTLHRLSSWLMWMLREQAD